MAIIDIAADSTYFTGAGNIIPQDFHEGYDTICILKVARPSSSRDHLAPDAFTERRPAAAIDERLLPATGRGAEAIWAQAAVRW
jgi:hypothetical protein